VLAPQIFVLIAAGLLKLAYQRWATSLVCLRVSRDGLSLPGIAARRIPWADVRSVRSVACTPTPDHTSQPRQYLLFEVNMPTVSRVGQPAFLWWRAQLLVLDVRDLDVGKDAILDAVYRYHPAAVADAEVGRTFAASRSAVARVQVPGIESLRFAAQCIRAETVSLLADCGELRAAAVAAWHRAAPHVRREVRLLMLGAAILRRSAAVHVQWLTLTLRDMATANIARGHRTVRVAAVVIRHRFVRSA
jgi:hypothetical protein